MVETAAEKPTAIYRKDYKPTPYLVDTVSLSFDLNEDITTVTTLFKMVPNYESGAPPAINFNGRADMTLDSIKVNGEKWAPERYTLTPKILTLEGLPQGEFPIEIVTKIKPQENSCFEGLYKSSGIYCTQVGGPCWYRRVETLSSRGFLVKWVLWPTKQTCCFHSWEF